VTKRILAYDMRKLFAFEVDGVFSAHQFARLRTAIRNKIDAERRGCPWWHSVCIAAWLDGQGTVRGIVALDALTLAEFTSAFEPGISLCPRAISAEEVREKVETVVVSIVSATGPRYQSVKLWISPKKSKRRQRAVATEPYEPWSEIEPMPVIM
jgi:hypothetical protein